MCGQISYYKTTVQRLKRNALFNLKMRGGMDSLHRDFRMEDGIRDKIDLSIRGQVVDNAGQRSPGPFQLVLMMTAWVRSGC